MPGSKGKGGKKKRRCKNEVQVKRSLVLAEEDQAYAKVIKMLGNARLQADCYIKLSDGQFKMETKVCLIRGSMRKRVWINSGDVVLVSIREFDNSKGDVIHKYEPDEVSKLIRKKHMPSIKFDTHPSDDSQKKKTNEKQEVIVEEESIQFQNEESDTDDSDEDIENI